MLMCEFDFFYLNDVEKGRDQDLKGQERALIDRQK